MSTNAKLYELVAEDVREGNIEMSTLLDMLFDACLYLSKTDIKELAESYGYEVEY